MLVPCKTTDNGYTRKEQRIYIRRLRTAESSAGQRQARTTREARLAADKKTLRDNHNARNSIESMTLPNNPTVNNDLLIRIAVISDMIRIYDIMKYFYVLCLWYLYFD